MKQADRELALPRVQKEARGSETARKPRVSEKVTCNHCLLGLCAASDIAEEKPEKVSGAGTGQALAGTKSDAVAKGRYRFWSGQLCCHRATHLLLKRNSLPWDNVWVKGTTAFSGDNAVYGRFNA